MLTFPLEKISSHCPGLSGVTILSPQPQQQRCAAVEYFFEM